MSNSLERHALMEVMHLLKETVGEDWMRVASDCFRKADDAEAAYYAMLEAVMDHYPGFIRKCHPDGSPVLRDGAPVFMKMAPQ